MDNYNNMTPKIKIKKILKKERKHPKQFQFVGK